MRSAATWLDRSRLAIAMAVAIVFVGACKGGGWSTYGGDGFRVDVPAAPEVSTEKQLTGATFTEVHRIVVKGGARGYLQVVFYTVDVPHDAVASAEKLDCEYPYTKSKFVADASRDLQISGAPAVGISGTAPPSESLPNGGFEEDRCVIVGTRMYHAMAIGPNTDSSRADLHRFLDSFAIDSPAVGSAHQTTSTP